MIILLYCYNKNANNIYNKKITNKTHRLRRRDHILSLTRIL